VLLYIFLRIEQRLDGSPTLILLDEAWAYLQHELFRDRLKDWLKTMRRKEANSRAQGFRRNGFPANRRFPFFEQAEDTGVLPKRREKPPYLRPNCNLHTGFDKHRAGHRFHQQTKKSQAEGEQHQSRIRGLAEDTAPRFRVGHLDKPCLRVQMLPGENERDRVLTAEEESRYLKATAAVGDGILAAYA